MSLAYPQSADRVGETATTAGSGNFTLAGALYQFRAFAAVYAVSDVFTYVIEHLTSNEWEVGVGKLVTNTTTLQRVAILASSNAGAAVSFSAGQKRVYVTDAAEAIAPRQHVFQARLTLLSGTPAPTTDQTGKTTVYVTPMTGLGNEVWLYTNSHWKRYELTEISLAPTLAASKVYDVFLYDNAGTLTLETVVWTDDTNRATALTAQDGVYLKSSDFTRRYVGSFRTNGSSQIEDSLLNRYVWNLYNQVQRPLKLTNTTDFGYTYGTNAYRQVNANTANVLNVLAGLAGAPINVQAALMAQLGGTAGTAAVGIGVDSTTVNSAQGGTGISATYIVLTCRLDGTVALGAHAYKWLESAVSGATTWYAQNYGYMTGYVMG